MKIVLFTYNHVVKEFITLVADKLGADLDIVQKVKDAENAVYDYVFIDDKDDLMQESRALIESSADATSVLLYGGENNNGAVEFDYSVKKPFLPLEIEELITKQTSNSSDEEWTKKEESVELFSDAETENIDIEIDKGTEVQEEVAEKIEVNETQILNNDDINEIKALLGDSGLDLATESNTHEPKKVKSKTKKKNKATKKSKSSKRNKKMKNKKKACTKSRKKAEKKLLKALFSMDKKEIRKLLKDANIILKIEYPDEQ